MTPEGFARNLARSDRHADRVLGVAIITRGTTDPDPADPTRQPWPLTAATVERAAQYLDLDPSPELVRDALALAPDVSGAMLNRGAAGRLARRLTAPRTCPECGRVFHVADDETDAAEWYAGHDCEA